MAAPNYAAILQQQQAQATKAAAPTVTAMEKEKQPLIQRYQSVLDQIAANQSAAITGQQTTSSREFGRRGIPLSSGIFETTLEERLNPIRREYSGLTSQTGAEREQALADLATRIAGVMSGASQNAIQAALSLYGQQYGAYQQHALTAKQQTFEAQQNALNRAAQQKAASTAAVTPSFNIPGLTTAPKGQTAPTVSQIFKSLTTNLKGGYQGFVAKLNALKGLTSAEKKTLTSMYNKTYSPVVWGK